MKMHFISLSIILMMLNLLGLNAAYEVPDHFRTHARKLHNLCMKQTGVPEEIIREGVAGALAADRLMQCYLHCIFDKVGLIDESNIIHMEHLLEVLPQELIPSVQRLIDSCGTQGGVDGCETVYLTVKCYIKTDPDLLMNKFSFLFE